MKTIRKEMQENQLVFNGFGAQTINDFLFRLGLHPFMPCFFICHSDHLFQKFLDGVCNLGDHYEETLSPKEVSVTCSNPFYFNESAHDAFMSTVDVFGRETVSVSIARYNELKQMGLFDPGSILFPDGSAQSEWSEQSILWLMFGVHSGVPGVTPLLQHEFEVPSPHPNYESIELPVYVLRAEGDTKLSCFTPFLAQPDPRWVGPAYVSDSKCFIILPVI
jgi:hypothetical protein